MKEFDFLKIINKTLSKNSYLGDDCAYLKTLGIVITQDTLVEDIHFSKRFSSPYQIAYKAAMANLSDVFAAGAEPKYMTISLSLPKTADNKFVEEFYSAIDDAAREYDFEIVGGDLTGSDKIFVSICAVGITKKRNISSRKNAKVGDVVITTGFHGSSAAGLWLLENNFMDKYLDLIQEHLKPTPQRNFSEEISTKTQNNYAMMDTSDGLIDALFKIAEASKVTICADFEKIPYDKKIEKIANLAKIDFKDWVLYGGEDFQLVACLNNEDLKEIKTPYTIIGEVVKKKQDCFVELNISDKKEKINNLEKTFNHFKEQK